MREHEWLLTDTMNTCTKIICCFTAAAFISPAIALAAAPGFSIVYSSARKVVSPQLSSNPVSTAPVNDFSLNIISSDDVLAGSSSATTSIKDLSYEQYIPGTVRHWCNKVNVIGAYSAPSYLSTNPSVETIDQSGNATYIGDGQTNFNVTIDGRTRKVICDVTTVVGQDTSILTGFDPSSLAENIKSNIDSLINGFIPGPATYDLYSSTNDPALSYVRNAGLFAHSIDLTAIPVYSSSNGTEFNGILVAPDVLIQANHAHSTGAIYFVDENNNTVSREITGGSYIGSDIYVAKLSSPLPSSITPAYVLASSTLLTVFQPAGSTSTSPLLTQGAEQSLMVPLIYTNQFRALRIGSLYYVGRQAPFFTFPYYGAIQMSVPPSSSPYFDWYSQVIGGDSGSPLMTIIGNKLVALGTWTYPGISSDLSQFLPQINAAMTALGSSYQLTVVDMSGYPTY